MHAADPAPRCSSCRAPGLGLNDVWLEFRFRFVIRFILRFGRGWSSGFVFFFVILAEARGEQAEQNERQNESESETPSRPSPAAPTHPAPLAGHLGAAESAGAQGQLGHNTAADVVAGRSTDGLARTGWPPPPRRRSEFSLIFRRYLSTLDLRMFSGLSGPPRALSSPRLDSPRNTGPNAPLD